MIIKTISGCLLAAALALAPQVRAVTTQDTIRADETWSRAVTVSGNLTVIDGLLTIAPGTQVGFATSTLMFKIKGQGAIRAVGTPDSLITFTRGCVTFEALERDSLCVLQYCEFQNKYHLVEFRNPDGLLECSAPRIDHCLFHGGGYTCIYVTSGASPAITHCTFHDAACGIFLHGADDVYVAYCTIYNTSCGIINASIDTWFQDLVVDHVTINNIDTTGGYVWSKGLGLTCGNTPGTLTITNSIIANTVKLGINNPTTANYKWAVTEDYNCFFNNQGGAATFAPGAHSVIADPQFTGPGTGDFSFTATSPCWLAADDSLNIGAWQSGPVPVRDASGPARITRSPSVLVANNPFRVVFTWSAGNAPDSRISIYTVTGAGVAWLRYANQAVWDGRDMQGHMAPAGVYLAVVRDGRSAVACLRFIKTE